MLWFSPAVPTMIAEDPGSSDPLGGVLSSAAASVLGYGILGVVVLAMSWLAWKRWRLISPAQEDKIRAEAREEGRSDLLRQIEQMQADTGRLREDLALTGRQRDEAQNVARDQLMPLLINFTSATQALLPILQALASQGWRPRHHDDE